MLRIRGILEINSSREMGPKANGGRSKVKLVYITDADEYSDLNGNDLMSPNHLQDIGSRKQDL